MHANIVKNGWNLTIDGTSEVYITHNGHFVGRFKYARPGASARHFAAFLVKHFTPAEYFAAYAEGVPPAKVLEAKGYVCLNVLRGAKHGDAVCLRIVDRIRTSN